MEEGIHVLTNALRPRVVLKYIGQLALLLALLTLVPLGFGVMEHEWQRAWRYVVIITGLLLLGGWLARLPAPERIQGNEALTITALAFLLSPMLMAWPMMTGGVAYLDAMFETVSAVTTTGLSTLGSIEHRSDTFLFARAWMQWYGGLGIVILSIALLMGHNAVARRLVEPDESGETLVVTARSHARLSLLVYLAITALGLIVVWPLSNDGFSAVLHVLAAVSTGGFSSFDASLAGLARPAAVAVTVIAFLCAISLPLYWRAVRAGWHSGWRSVYQDVELRALIFSCLLIGSLLSWLAWRHGLANPWYHGFMMGISAQTTTGFATLPVADMDAGSRAIMILSMLVGGSVGSTAGGFKLLRLLIFLRLLRLTMLRTTMPPHAVADPYLEGHKLEQDDLLRVLQLILMFIGIMVLSWLPFVFMGYDPLDALFEVTSACGTVGLSTGISRPELEPLLKGLLCFDMLAGRLEIIALLVVLYPRSWIGRRENAQ